MELYSFPSLKKKKKKNKIKNKKIMNMFCLFFLRCGFFFFSFFI